MRVEQHRSTKNLHLSHSYYKKNLKNENFNNNHKKKEALYRDIFFFNEEKENSSEEDENPEINIILYYDGREIKTKFNRHKAFVDYVKYLQKKYFKIGFEQNYQIFYEGAEIPMNDKRKIKAITNTNNTEIKFMLKYKGKTFINSKLKKMYIELENIPSFMDLSDQINNFINSQKEMEINFDIKYKDNCCRILFSSSEIAFSFISYMTDIKFKNKYYRKLKIDIKYNALDAGKLAHFNSHNFRYLSQENLVMNENNKDENKSRNNTINNNIKSYRSYDSSKLKRKFENEYDEDNYKSIQDSSPYGYEKQLDRLKQEMSKKKWMGNKNFFTSINKYSFNKMISDKYYVKKFKNFNSNKNDKNSDKRKVGINPYTKKLFQLKISEA